MAKEAALHSQPAGAGFRRATFADIIAFTASLCHEGRPLYCQAQLYHDTIQQPRYLLRNTCPETPRFRFPIRYALLAANYWEAAACLPSIGEICRFADDPSGRIRRVTVMA